MFLKKKHPQLSNAHLTVSRLPNFNWSSLGNPGNDSVPQSQSSASQLLQPLRFGALHVDLSSMNNEQIRYVRFGTETVFLCFIVGGCQKYPNRNKPREPTDLPLALQRTPQNHEEGEPIGICWRMTTLENLASTRTSQRS